MWGNKTHGQRVALCPQLLTGGEAEACWPMGVFLHTWQEAGSAHWLRVNFRLEEKGHKAVNLKKKKKTFQSEQQQAFI